MIPDVTPNGVFYLPPTGWLTSFYNPPNNFVLLNHYTKKKDETDPRQIERALSLLDDWYERKGK